MNPLLKRLASLRRKVLFLNGCKGICALLTLVLGVGVAVGVLDYWIHLPSLVRALTLIGLLIGGGALVYWQIYRPFTRSSDDLSLALRVEQVYPDLNDSLASTVQFLKQSKEDQQRVGGSESMRQKTIQETLDKAEKCDFGRIIHRRAALLFGLCALSVLILVGTVVYLNPGYSGTAFLRLIEPFGQHSWTRITVARSQTDEEQKWKPLDPQGQVVDRIAIRRPYAIKVELAGKIPPQATVEIEGKGKVRTDKTIALKPGEDRQSASFVTAIDMTQQQQTFKFRIVANDGSFPPRPGAWHEVEVLPPPSLVDLDGQKSPQITLFPPEYTDLPTMIHLPPGTRHLELYAGTNVALRARADRPLEKAWIEYRPENNLVTPAALVSFLGQTHPLQMVAQAAGSHAVWGRFEAKKEKDEMTFQINFMPWVSGWYTLCLRDKDRLDSREEYNLNVQTDPVPDVKLVRPGSSVTALPDANVGLKFRVTDEIFAIKSVYVEYRLKKPDGTLVGKAESIVLYDAKDYGKLLPMMMAKMGPAFLLGPDMLSNLGRNMWTGPDLHLRYKQMDFETVWSLRNQFQEGDIVVVEVCALDFCNIYPKREPGRSHAFEMRILGRQQLLTDVKGKLVEIQQNLVRAETMQKKALDTTKETKTKQKIDQPVKDAFDEGKLTQRELENLIGKSKEEGIRRDLNEIRQVLKENKLTNTDAFKLTEKIRGALDQLAAQELPQIGPKLAEVRNELEQNKENNPKIGKKLDQAAKLQDKVHKALQELNHELAPLHTMNQTETKLREILAKQKEIQQKLEEMKGIKEDIAKNDPASLKKLEAAQKEQIAGMAQEQRDLAQQMEKVTAEMKAQQQKRIEEGDKANAQKLKEAIEKLVPKQEEQKPPPKKDEQKPKADPTPTSGKMKDAADALRDKNEAPQQALDKQKQIVKDLDEALAAMEGRNKDFAKEDIRERMKAEQKLDQLANELKKLQEENKNFQNEKKQIQEQIKKLQADGKNNEKQIEDLQERLKKKEQELAKKHEALQEKFEKAGRELARLNEPRAANEVNDAADNLQKAGQKLQQGDDGQEEQKQAQKKLEEAKKELQDAEQQLSREMLIQMADKLKGLKERQDAALERTEKLHKKIMKDKSWRDSYLDTIEGTIDTQKGIGDETDSLKDKLKDAKVFHSILERAKDSMDKAGEAMTNRRDLGKERRYLEKGDGELMDAKELKDEVDSQTLTVKHQKQASQRLDRILEALKQEIAKKPKKQPDQVAKKDEEKPDKKDKEKQNMRPDPSGIPPMAQLKALKSEQLDLNERTEEFAKRNPAADQLNEEQRRELLELEQEQERLRDLFQELVTPPQQKEGEL